MLVYDPIRNLEFTSLPSWIPALRCLNCGVVIEQGILENRINPPKIEKRRWQKKSYGWDLKLQRKGRGALK
jgi:hypothetical protein